MSDHLLLIADDGFDGADALPDIVTSAAKVQVVGPIIGSRLDTLTEDEALYEDAQQRVDRIVAQLESAGVDATGQVSESGPLAAAQTMLAGGDYDAVVVAGTGEDHWREDGMLEDLRASTDVTVHCTATAS